MVLHQSLFDQCLNFVLKWEGGYFHHPNDPGGMTMRGITLSAWNRFSHLLGLQKVLNKDKDLFVQLVSRENAAKIYLHGYYAPLMEGTGLLDSYPKTIMALFDLGVNSGLGRAFNLTRKLWCPEAADTKPLSRYEKDLLKICLQNWGDEKVAEKIINLRFAFLKKLRNWKYFGNGWSNRCYDLRKEIKKQGMNHANISTTASH